MGWGLEGEGLFLRISRGTDSSDPPSKACRKAQAGLTIAGRLRNWWNGDGSGLQSDIVGWAKRERTGLTSSQVSGWLPENSRQRLLIGNLIARRKHQRDRMLPVKSKGPATLPQRSHCRAIFPTKGLRGERANPADLYRPVPQGSTAWSICLL